MANVTVQTPEPPAELLPTHKAAVKNDIQELSRLLQEKAPLVDPSTKETPLHAAAKTGSVEALKWLMKNKAVQLDSRTTTGYTSAHLAAVYGHIDCLKVREDTWLSCIIMLRQCDAVTLLENYW